VNTFAQKDRDTRSEASQRPEASQAGYSSKEDDGQQLDGSAERRPAAIVQRALEESLQHSPRVQSQLRLGEMLNASGRVAAQAKLATTLSARHLNRQTPQPLQRMPQAKEAELTGDEIETSALSREATMEEEEPLQGKFGDTGSEAAPAGEDSSEAKPGTIQRQENKTGLPDQVKAGVEQLSGVSLDDVRVHYNSSAPSVVQALAYTQGSEIHVRSGQEKHLAHEAWHVVQQKQGRVRPTMQVKSMDVNDDAELEREADVMGARAAQQNVAQAQSLEPGGSKTDEREAVPAVLQPKQGVVAQFVWLDDGTDFLLWDSVLDGVKWYYKKSEDRFYYVIVNDAAVPYEYWRRVENNERHLLTEDELDAIGFEEVGYEAGENRIVPIHPVEPEPMLRQPGKGDTLSIERDQTGKVQMIVKNADSDPVAMTFTLGAAPAEWKAFADRALGELSRSRATEIWANRNFLENFFFKNSESLKIVKRTITDKIFAIGVVKPPPQAPGFTDLRSALGGTLAPGKALALPTPRLSALGAKPPAMEPSAIAEVYAILDYSMFGPFFAAMDKVAAGPLDELAQKGLADIESGMSKLMELSKLLGLPKVTEAWNVARVKLSGTIAKEGNKQALESWNQVYEEINKFTVSTPKGIRLTLDLINAIHGQMIRGSAKNDARGGITREKTINVGANPPLPSHFVGTELAQLINWMNIQIEISAKNPAHILTSCAVFLSKFLTIHPFDDGNGRTARAVIDLVLQKFGFPPTLFEKPEVDVALTMKHPMTLSAEVLKLLATEKVDPQNEAQFKEWISQKGSVEKLEKVAPGLLKASGLVIGKEEELVKDPEQYVARLIISLVQAIKRAIAVAQDALKTAS
jgi:fido (protein-threonine AMPylation protein)